MKKLIALFFFCRTLLFAESFVLENKSSYQIAVQWATSARMVQESNEGLMQEEPIKRSDLYYPKKQKETISIPQDAVYFRVIAWETRKPHPDFATNWIEIVPNKTYLVKDEYLTPIILMNGMGC